MMTTYYRMVSFTIVMTHFPDDNILSQAIMVYLLALGSSLHAVTSQSQSAVSSIMRSRTETAGDLPLQLQLTRFRA